MSFKLKWITGALENFETELNNGSKLSNLYMYKFLVETGFDNIRHELSTEDASQIEHKIFMLSKKLEEVSDSKSLDEMRNDYDLALGEYARLLDELKKDKTAANMREACYARDYIEAILLGLKENKINTDTAVLDNLDAKRVGISVSPGEMPPWGEKLPWWNGK